MSTYDKVTFRNYYVSQPAIILKFFMQQKSTYLCQNSERNKKHGDRPTSTVFPGP